MISEPKPSSSTGKDNDGDSDETNLDDDPDNQKLLFFTNIVKHNKMYLAVHHANLNIEPTL